MYNAQDWQAAQAARNFAAAALVTAHPHLVPVSDKANALVAAGKNIRIELAAAFPGVKFAVRSSRYSGGNSIDVRWVDGPTSGQVDAIINRYQAGSFDGSTDCYNYRGDHAWPDAFGSAKYVHSTREYSDRMVASVMGRVCRWLGGLDRTPTVDDYRTGRLYSINQSGGCEVDREVHRALSRHTYCA